MLRFCHDVIKCIAPCLTVSYMTLLDYSTLLSILLTAPAEHTVTLVLFSQCRLEAISACTYGAITQQQQKFEAINYVSGVFFYLPQLKGKAPGSTRLLVTWGKCKLLTQAPPLSTFSLTVFAGDAVVGASLYASHRRTAQNSHIHFSLMEQRSRGIVVLPETKSGQPTASNKTVLIFGAYWVRMLAFVCRNLAPAEFLMGNLPLHFRLNCTEPLQPPARPKYHTCLFAAQSIRTMV